MDYIVLDMEWNQPWPGSPSAKRVPARGEIIQIGAVRVTENQKVADEFQVMVQPRFFRRLNSRVSKLTGIRESSLRENGVPMEDAMERFRRWCGEDVIFLTWGFDDVTILLGNLHLYGIDDSWVSRWYNAQMIFNAQTDGSSSQKALKTAMEHFEIPPSRPAHDALGDAYHTALICARLDLSRGIQEYNAALKSHENGFHGAELPGCIDRHVFYDYADKAAALEAMSGRENKCPVCGGQMHGTRWFAQPGHRYMDMACCPRDGNFLIRIRLSEQPDGTVRASRLTYEGGSEAAQAYARRAEKASDPPAAHHSIRRRHRRRKQLDPAANG